MVLQGRWMVEWFYRIGLMVEWCYRVGWMVEWGYRVGWMLSGVTG